MTLVASIAERLPRDVLLAERAKRHFTSFLDFVWITEPRPDGGNSHIKFEKWAHLLDAIKHLETDRYLVVPKPRQIGWSWLIAAWALWNTAYKKNFKALLFSQGEMEAYDLLAKVVYIWTNLPPLLKPERTNDSRQALDFGAEWWIRAFPSTPKAGHGTTAGLVVADEADYHEYLEQAYSAIKPTIDDVGGQLILISKCNPLRPQSLFKRIARGAPNNGFKCLFYPWNVRENRTAAWHESIRATYTDLFDFQKSYPSTLEEALESPAELRVISGALLAAYRREARPPVRVEGHYRIWQDWVPSRRYIAGTDTGHGVGLDKSVTVVMDVASGAVAAVISTRNLDALDFTVESLGLLRMYGNPTWVVESNDWGCRVIDRAMMLRYPRLFYQESGKPGWKTNQATRPLVWSSLMEAVTSRTLVAWDEELIDELADLIRNPEKGGRVEAAGGANDDYCMAIALALYNQDWASSNSYEPTETLQYATRRRGGWKWQ